jgi:hypothetical protein
MCIRAIHGGTMAIDELRRDGGGRQTPAAA